MAGEVSQLCQLRPEIVDMAIEDALALILNCRVVDAERYQRLSRKHAELRKWIEGK